MGGYGTDAAPISTQTTHVRRDYIDFRANRMRWSRADLLGLLIDRWFASGCPALTEAEAILGIPPIPAECLKRE